MIIFVLSLGAELIANEKPLLVSYQHSLYFPVIKTYPETTFGGVFETEAEYRDPAVKHLIEKDGWMLWPPIPFSYQTPNMELAVPVPSPPSAPMRTKCSDRERRNARVSRTTATRKISQIIKKETNKGKG